MYYYEPPAGLHRAAVRITLLAATLLAATRIQAQQLSLGDALHRGDRTAYANVAARGVQQAQRAEGTRALRGILPTVRMDAGYVRSTDPVAVFGTTLRQRSITQQNFDPARLNFPDPVPNYAATIVLEQPLFNADAWAGRTAAAALSEATAAATRWTAIDTRVEIVRTYFAAILAGQEVVTLDAALGAAREHVRQAEALVKNGLATPSDALLAAVKAGETETALIEARGRAATAHLALAVALGNAGDTSFTLPGVLPAREALVTLARDARQDAPQQTRDDIISAQLRREAAARDILRARSLYLPRINSFARYDWNAAAQPFAGVKNWSVGVMASWTPFAGAYEIAELQATGGQQQASDAEHRAIEARAQLELEQSAVALDVGVARMGIAHRSAQQSAEAYRIVARKYAGGIATIVELLDAAATQTSSQLADANARFAVITAIAVRHRALGSDPGALRALDETSAAEKPLNPNER